MMTDAVVWNGGPYYVPDSKNARLAILGAPWQCDMCGKGMGAVKETPAWKRRSDRPWGGVAVWVYCSPECQSFHALQEM